MIKVSSIPLSEHLQPPETVNTEHYVEVLRNFWTALGRRRGVDRAVQWFQQDGATPQTSNVSAFEWLKTSPEGCKCAEREKELTLNYLWTRVKNSFFNSRTWNLVFRCSNILAACVKNQNSIILCNKGVITLCFMLLFYETPCTYIRNAVFSFSRRKRPNP